MNPAQVAQMLFGAIQQVRHYGPDHPASREAIAEAYRVLAPQLTQGSVRLNLDERSVTVQATPLPLTDRAAAQLHAYLSARRIGDLTIDRGASADDLAALIRLLAREPEELIVAGGLQEALATHGVSGISVKARSAAFGVAPTSAANPYGAAVHTIHEIMIGAERGERVDMPKAVRVAEGLVAVLGAERERLWRDVADRGHDELDPAHAVDTCLLTLFMAEAFALRPQAHVDLGVAALLHDVGMAVLPWGQRLAERTAATPRADWRHPAEGAFLLRHLGGRESVPMIVAAEHHLPALGQTGVLPHTRLIALADYFDAASCGRVPAMRQASAGAIMQQLLHGVAPAFDRVHVHVLAALLHQQQEVGVEFSTTV